jgi:hypothetical protein
VFVFTDLIVIANEKYRVLAQYALATSHVQLPSGADQTLVLAAASQSTFGVSGPQMPTLLCVLPNCVCICLAVCVDLELCVV